MRNYKTQEDFEAAVDDATEAWRRGWFEQHDKNALLLQAVKCFVRDVGAGTSAEDTQTIVWQHLPNLGRLVMEDETGAY